MMNRLDHLAVGLSGMNLIEASAGTGKTYAIAALYLRLLLEKELLPDQILVVTYTEAATQELRSRIRRRIRETLDALLELDGQWVDEQEPDEQELDEHGPDEQRADRQRSGKQGSGDPFLNALCDRAIANGGGIRERQLLRQALDAFDTAAIFTIHGFCLRALQDHAFESGSLYDTEIVTDQNALLQELVDDFWRQHFFGQSAPLLGYALQKNASVDSFLKLLKSLHGGTGIEVRPTFSREEIDGIEAACHEAFSMIASLWHEKKEEITTLLTNDKGLSRAADQYKSSLLPELFDSMDAFVTGGNPYDLFDGFSKFTSSGIAKGTKKKGTPPTHELFTASETLFRLVERRFLALQAELVVFYREELPRRKRSGNVRFFDDLLSDLYHALSSADGVQAQGERLAGMLRERFQAALIDEFQDTDPVQYEIFRKIYAGSGLPLFLIGDPKQAIYSFRGADLFAYLRAAREVPAERRFTLTSNWRSTPLLLKAFNILFLDSRHPFLYKEIASHPLEPGGEPAPAQGEEVEPSAGGEPAPAQSTAHEPVTDAQAASASAPMQICFMEPAEGESGLKFGDAWKTASSATARRIEKLLHEGRAGTALVGGRPVEAGDIAVIVRSHRQAAMIQADLRKRGIKGVMRSDQAIFATREAEEVLTLLLAIADPAHEPKVRAALVTDMLGRSGSDIDRLLHDESAWVQCLQSFAEYHRIWLERDVMVMTRELVARESVRGRLLARVDGERRMTNLLHCFELLHREAHERGLGMEGVVSWFSERIASGEAAEEYQIRLESDEAAVRIVTVHVSKGLEYPVVFCPFLLAGVTTGNDMIMFHDADGRQVRVMGADDIAAHRQEAEKELLAENLRLLYVALTRAKHRCYLFSGRIIDGRRAAQPVLSPASYLLHASGETKTADDPVTAAGTEVHDKSAETLAVELQALADESGGSIGFSRIRQGEVDELFSGDAGGPRSAEIEELAVARVFSATVERDWRVSSFTSFSRHAQKSAELPDRDESQVMLPVTVIPPVPDTKRDIFAFPRGAQAGILMHELFETLDFASSTGEMIRDLVEKALDRQGYSREWVGALSTMVQAVLDVPLSLGHGSSFSLGSLKTGTWVTELEFFVPLSLLTSPKLAGLLAHYGVVPDSGVDLAALAQRLDFRPARGVLMGFMDMVFEVDGRYYLLDWKSNHLGNSVKEYCPEALRMAMQEHLYPLQYLLYVVALDRYLSMRVKGYRYDTHFGGVIYVFLRGVSPEEGESCGFFRDQPPEALIAGLRDLLVETECTP